MKNFLHFLVMVSLLLASDVYGQQPKNVQMSQAAVTRGEIIEDLKFGNGKTLSFLNGATLSISGALSGTPSEGTLNLSNLSLTLPPINNTPIGATTPSTGAFTTLATNNTVTHTIGTVESVNVVADSGGSKIQFTSEGGASYTTTNHLNNAGSAHVDSVHRALSFQFLNGAGGSVFLQGDSVYAESIQSPGAVPLVLGANYGTHLTIAADGNVGIGTTPSVRLHVSGDNQIAQFTTTGTSGLMQLTNTSASANNTSANIGLGNNDGAALAFGDRMGALVFNGNNGGGATSLTNSALIGVYADENWINGTNYGSRIEFELTPAGSPTRSTRATLSGTGLAVTGNITATGWSANVQSFLAAADYAAMRTAMSVPSFAELAANNVSGVNTDGLVHWSQLVGVPAGFADGSDDGTVTNTGGNLTANAFVLGAGGVDTKVSTGITSDGTAQVVLGVNATTAGSIKLFGGTSGNVTLTPTAAAGTGTALTLPATTGTLALTSQLTASGVGLSNVTNDAQTQAAIVPNTVPSAGQILAGNAGGTAYAPVSVSGDLTLASTGAATLATVNSNVGTYGSATAASVVTVNAKGLVTAASNVTVTPAVGSITGLGTGIASALGVNTGSAGAPVLFDGAGGTPSSLTLTNATGLPTAGLVDGAVTLAKMANLAQDQFIGRVTASTGVPQTTTITAAARSVLDDTTVADMVNTLGGATSSGTGGLARVTGATLTTATLAGNTTVSGNVGVGTDAPTAKLTVSNNPSTLPSSPANTNLLGHFAGPDASTNTSRVLIDSFGGTPSFTSRRANGTNASRSALTSGQFIGGLSAIGHKQTDYYAGGYIQFAAAENWTDSAAGTDLAIGLTPIGQTAQFTGFRFTSEGVFTMYNRYTAPSEVASAGQLYIESGALKYVGSSGAVSGRVAFAEELTAYASDTVTLTNKRITSRTTSITSNATWAPDVSTTDLYIVTAQAEAATTISNPAGSPTEGQRLMMRIKDNGTARLLTWSGSQWRASTDLALPTTTTLGKTLYLGFIYNSTDTKWDLVARLDNF